jgi:hypothetical protein
MYYIHMDIDESLHQTELHAHETTMIVLNPFQ